ncbi:hypothetical protein KXW98_007036 [Aspergillus fumigatus]|uniref:Protein FAF1 n=3 Tax=Aspergillus fumigatus TaxID=746128 RepID=Q4WTU9_ASPFU|nr:conserved hypothetical protein [Aspergillus fumigatus Af293]EDP51367.1 conserved hypothetical protein [Aspergillus fumigatus A1163]KAF4265701.1 hypothetical protein CNMCM8714_006265 [Aspergillus fumigatus]KMK59269.1 hypothetical protein Y699_00470 [Aspergillus fumigatus Z5]EAL91977.1 conserved hypothetical protein [Aspergillus fumigatus Af293]KAF4271157.1 hypothetical protein CNMCM8057_007382 [Aspergillus fumigatus]
MIGKRKRDTAVVSRSSKTEDEDQTPTVPDTSLAHDLFRKFFEAQFEPLELPGGQISREQESQEDGQGYSDGSEPESEWDGVSEEEGNRVEVVEYQDKITKEKEILDKKARKAFMTAKPPTLSTESTTTKPASKKAKNKKEEDDDDDMDAEHLKNDLALQRLLKESHLLDSASELAPTGKNRLKALDLRMQSLGAKTSLYQQNMPSSLRRGIKAKALMKEEKRRREAKENGIILERPTPKSKVTKGRRERGIAGPGIGKLSGGTLNLSKRDIAVVQSARRSRRGGRGKSKTRGRH